MLEFDLLKENEPTGEDRTRLGRITTEHGTIETPIFMPVGTVGSVKGVSKEDLDHCGAQIILGNTYHLYLRPGCEVIDPMGGAAQIYCLGQTHAHRFRRVPVLFPGQAGQVFR